MSPGYNIHYLIAAREEQAWRFVAQGNLSPDSQKLITTVPHDSLNAFDVVAVQLSAWKEEGLFLLKPAVDARLRIDPLRLMKTGAYAESPRFQTSVLSYSIVKDDVVAHPVVVDRDNLKADMYHKDSVKVTKKKIMRPSVTMVPLLSICMLTSSLTLQREWMPPTSCSIKWIRSIG